MKIQILGSGCAKCRALTAVTEQAADDMGLTVRGREGHRREALTRISA